MAHNQFSLLGSKRFLPLFLTQFLGAFHDNVFKNALVALLLYGIATSSAVDNTEILVTMAAAIFILPFILFSALGGQLADKFSKHRIIRSIKFAEIAIACLGALALLSSSIELSFITLFALGTQSAFFGPSKYAILPDHLEEDELIAGNALLNTGTFLSVLCGTIAGTVLIIMNAGIFIVSGLLVASAVLGYIASRSIPQTMPKAGDLKLDYNPLKETYKILRDAFRQKSGVVQSILGVAWFYFLGGMFMAQFANYTQGTLSGDQTVLAFFLVVFSVGIAIGGLLNNVLLKGRVEAVYVPLAILGITIFSIDLYFAGDLAPRADLLNLSAFLVITAHWRVIFDVAMIALCGGLFVVPLNAIIQRYTDVKKRARIIAASAILNAIFIFGSAALSAYLIYKNWEIREIFLLFAVMNAFVAILYLPFTT